jgi:16S rRNA processing protein RimM
VTPPPHLEVGYVARAPGLHGEVAVRTHDPASDVFDEVERLLVVTRTGAQRTLTIESVRPTPREVLVVFTGVATREAGEALVGARVLAFREDLAPPQEGEYFQGDLVGLVAVDEGGRELGRVEALWNAGDVPNLVIRGEGTGELLVPFADEFVPTVDLAAGRLVVRVPRYTTDESA